MMTLHTERHTIRSLTVPARGGHRGRGVLRAWLRPVMVVAVLASVALVGSATASEAASPSVGVVSPPSVGVGAGPDGLVVDASTHTLYVVNETAGSVSVIDSTGCTAGTRGSCRSPVGTVPLPAGAHPSGITLDTATKTIYTANNGGSVSVIDAASCNATDTSDCGSPVASVADPAGPAAIAVDQATDTIYVANYGPDLIPTGTTVSVLDGVTCNSQVTEGCGQAPETIGVGQAPDGVAVDPVTDTVYVANAGLLHNDGTTVSVIDGATCNRAQTSGCGQKSPSITVGHGPQWIALDLQTHTAYTPNASDSDVSVIDIASCNAEVVSGCDQKVRSVRVGSFPYALAVDQVNHTVYVANNLDQTLSAFNASTCNSEDHSSCSLDPPTVQVGAGPQALAIDPTTDTAYVANFSDNTVSRVDTSGCDANHTAGCRSEAPTAPVGSDPAGVAIDSSTHTLYIANQGSGTVSVLNTSRCEVSNLTGCDRPVTAIHVGGQPTGVAVDETTDSVYVANNAGDSISMIDGATCSAAVQSGCGQSPSTITVGTNPFGVALNPTTDTVYVTDLGPTDEGDTVSVVDGATCDAAVRSGCAQTPATVTVGSGPFGIAVNPTTDTVYVANTGQLFVTADGTTVSVIDGATCNGADRSGCGAASATVTVGRAPFGLAVDQPSNTIYVVNNQGGDSAATLSKIDGAHCDSVDTSACASAPAGSLGPSRAPNGIVLDQATDTLYTANFYNATVSAVSLSGHRGIVGVTRMAVGSAPVDVAIDPANHTVYAADSLDGTVSIVPTSR